MIDSAYFTGAVVCELW